MLNLFKANTFNKTLFTVAFPVVVQNLMLALVAAGDAFMLGHLDQNAMAAVSLATQVQFIQNMLLWAITSGIMILGAQYWGKKDTKVLDEIFGSSIREAVLVSVAFFIGCYYFPEKLMLIFARDQELIEPGAEYLRLASWSYLITGISQVYLAVMRVSDHVSRTAWISSGAVIFNIILNAIFIFGLCGAPAMGIRGAALATILARVIELVWCVASSFEKSFIRLQFKSLITFNWQLIREFWKYAVPILGSGLLWGVGFMSYTAIMGHMGTDAAAANAIAAVVRDILCCLCNGIAVGAGIMIGNKLGAGKLLAGKKYGERIVAIAFLIGFTCTILILASIPVVTNFVELTDRARMYMIGMFAILSIYMIGRCVCTVVINGIFSSGGDTLFDVYSLIICMWGIALPCAYFGAFHFELPVLVIYACTCLDEVGKIPWVIWHYKRYKWVKNITREDV